jgi:transglutaminase-like putative cysteine protease
VRDLSRKEFERWLKQGRFDRRTIDGEERFMVSSVSNLFFRYPELTVRRTPPKDTGPHQRATLENVRVIRQAAAAAGTPYVLPKTFDVTMNVTVNREVVPAGETIRAWLPIPRDYPHQGGYRLKSASGKVLAEAPGESPIRSLLLEQPAAASGEPTELSLNYTYTTWAVRVAPSPATAKLPDAGRADLAPFLKEGPHVEFTPELRALSERIAGREPNPVTKARKFYEWIAANIRYSYAVEYSTVRNLGGYCLERGYGDCGQEALLFITLCRLNGIPARWQSGWSTFPGAKTIHDWSEIYLEPHGWMPVDPYMGIFAMQYCPSLKSGERREIRDFYFGGLDQYRMIANSDHSQVLRPAGTALRSDTVDFQRGELEWNGRHLYFDQFHYDLTVSEIPDRRGKD